MTTITRADHLVAEALFASHLQPSQALTDDQIRAAVADTVRRLGCDGCAECMAAEFGDHPDTATARMAWALAAEARINARPVIHPLAELAMSAPHLTVDPVVLLDTDQAEGL